MNDGLGIVRFVNGCFIGMFVGSVFVFMFATTVKIVEIDKQLQTISEKIDKGASE